MLILSLIVLIASHIFYIAYSFEYYSLLFIALGLSILKNSNFTENA